MIITVYEYLLVTQPEVLVKLRACGLLLRRSKRPKADDLSYLDLVRLMRHDRWKRVRGALRQVHPGRVIR